MPYISNTDKDRAEMLSAIGVSSFAELVSNIPDKLKETEPMKLTEPLSEQEMGRLIFQIAGQNKCLNKLNSFLGGGVYDHFIPAAVDTIISRPEFYTAYTPYQAEVSQGTLTAIYEYQTLICELTGMDISNAGMYDGGSAAAEAILMANRKNKLTKVLVSTSLNPAYIDVIKTYTSGVGIEIELIPSVDGVTDIESLKKQIDDKTACVLIQTPNYFGNIEDSFAISTIIKEYKKTLFIPIVHPISLALLNAPSEYGADIVVGEGQSLGNKPYFGGPLFGFLAARMDLSRAIPGRIVGQTVDADGQRAYVLTLQAREQHIRRDKATSNICTNEALCSLAGNVYMCLMGKSGLREVAELCTTKAHYLAREIAQIPGFSMAFNQPFFNEFTIKTPIPPAEIIEKLSQKDILPGIDLSEIGVCDHLLIAVTEKKTKADLDNLVSALREVIA
jgi:glycine dehydrogenase subunit 1